MNKFLKLVIQNNHLEELLSHQITQKTIKVFLIQCTGIILALVSNFWIARMLNASGYGQFSFLVTIINLFSTFACLGFSSSLIRDIASYSSQGKFSQIKGMIQFSYWVSGAASVLFIAGLAIASYFQLMPFPLDYFTVAIIGITVLFSTLLLIRQFSLQGLGHTSESQIVNSLIRYVIILILLFILINLTASEIGVQEVILINGASVVLALLLIEIIFIKKVPLKVKNSPPIFHASFWIKSSLVLFAYKLMTTYLLSSEILLLGYLKSDEEVGVYSLARKIAGFTSFGLLAANVVLAPKIASLYSEGKLEHLQKLIRKSIRVIFIFSLLVTAGLALVSFPILQLLGEDYTNSYIPLLIMMTGELINVAFGPVAMLLINSNQERTANKIMLATVLVNVIATIVLIHYLGYIGAAISTAMTVVTWNILMAITVKKKIGIKSWI